MQSELITYANLDSSKTKFPPGWTQISNEDDSVIGVDFGIRWLKPGERVQEAHEKESAWLLMSGSVEITCGSTKAKLSRKSLFEDAPAVLHVPASTPIIIEAGKDPVEFSLARVRNQKTFEPKIFLPKDCIREVRGSDLVQGAAKRIVWTVFDARHRPDSKLVLGEVVNYPGRWSSYPPHYHDQPELYHYRFTEPQGYGHAEIGEHVFKVRHGDTTQIPGGNVHPQVCGPGYGMYYLWLVRHLEGNLYHGFTFVDEHKWILNPKEQGWRPPNEKND